MTPNNQSIKFIPYKDIYHMRNNLEQLQSWIIILEVCAKFFKNREQRVKKKKIIKEFYARSEIFEPFVESFLNGIDGLDNKNVKLESREQSLGSIV